MKNVGKFFNEVADNFEQTDCGQDIEQYMSTCFRDVEFSDKRIVDLGCGTGIYSQFFLHKKAKVLGIDASKLSLEKAKEIFRPFDGLLIKAEVPPIPLSNNSVDILFSKGTLPYISNIEGLLNEMLRIVTKDGLIVIELLRKSYLFKIANYARRILSKIPIERTTKFANIISFFLYPILKVILRKKARLLSGKKLAQIVMEVLFSTQNLSALRRQDIIYYCNKNNLQVNFLNIKSSKIYSPTTSFVIEIRKTC